MKYRIGITAALLSTSLLLSQGAAASDSLLGALLGAGAGVVVGHSVGGHDGAIVGGAIGAVAGAAIASEHHRSRDFRSPVRRDVYYGQPHVIERRDVYYERPRVLERRHAYYGRPELTEPRRIRYVERERHWDDRPQRDTRARRTERWLRDD